MRWFFWIRGGDDSFYKRHKANFIHSLKTEYIPFFVGAIGFLALGALGMVILAQNPLLFCVAWFTTPILALSLNHSFVYASLSATGVRRARSSLVWAAIVFSLAWLSTYSGANHRKIMSHNPVAENVALWGMALVAFAIPFANFHAAQKAYKRKRSEENEILSFLKDQMVKIEKTVVVQAEYEPDEDYRYRLAESIRTLVQNVVTSQTISRQKKAAIQELLDGIDLETLEEHDDTIEALQWLHESIDAIAVKGRQEVLYRLINSSLTLAD